MLMYCLCKQGNECKMIIKNDEPVKNYDYTITFILGSIAAATSLINCKEKKNYIRSYHLIELKSLLELGHFSNFRIKFAQRFYWSLAHVTQLVEIFAKKKKTLNTDGDGTHHFYGLIIDSQCCLTSRQALHQIKKRKIKETEKYWATVVSR